MTYSLLLAATLCLLLRPTSYQVDAGQDLTRIPGSNGTDVVEACVAQVRGFKLFRDDNQFLRRLAWVESQDGQSPDTYRNGYFGGIWQVDETVLLATQNVTNTPNLTHLLRNVFLHFNIEWLSVKKEDLLMPIYSALAARIFMWTLSDHLIPLASDIEGQGCYWQAHYRPTETVETFVELVLKLESEKECQTRGMDLVFLLDSSDSVNKVNFNTTLKFIADIVSQLDIGPSATQIGVVIFSNNSESVFHLNTYRDNVSVIQAVKRIRYLGGNTNTPEGLLMLIHEFTTRSFGARPKEQCIPRVAIVVTDGMSNAGGGYDVTIANAGRVHDKDIFTYAVGIGHFINESELNAIATNECYVHVLKSFDIKKLQKVQESLSSDTCQAPAIGDVKAAFNATLQHKEHAYIQFNLPRAGMTLKIEVKIGTIVVYISNKIRNPNEAIYDWKLETSSIEDVFISLAGLGISSLLPPTITPSSLLPLTITPSSLPPPTSIPQETMDTTDTNITIYVSVQGKAKTNMFFLDTTYGDTTVKEAAGSTTATTAAGTESSASMLLLWAVVGGTLFIGLVILIITIIIAKKIKRFTQHSDWRFREPPYKALVSLEEMWDVD